MGRLSVLYVRVRNRIDMRHEFTYKRGEVRIKAIINTVRAWKIRNQTWSVNRDINRSVFGTYCSSRNFLYQIDFLYWGIKKL